MFSAIVFAGSAQFASVSIIAAGGGAGAAVAAATLMNSRFLPMSAAVGPSFSGGPLKRAAKGQTVVDASWALPRGGRDLRRAAPARRFGARLHELGGRARGRRALGRQARRPERPRPGRDLPGLLLRAAPERAPQPARARRGGARHGHLAGARPAHPAGRADPRGEPGVAGRASRSAPGPRRSSGRRRRGSRDEHGRDHDRRLLRRSPRRSRRSARWRSAAASCRPGSRAS